jgi:hypothetical protein
MMERKDEMLQELEAIIYSSLSSRGGHRHREEGSWKEPVHDQSSERDCKMPSMTHLPGLLVKFFRVDRMGKRKEKRKEKREKRKG